MIKFVPLHLILIPDNRQRKYFDESKNQELITSITDTDVGLQNAIVIRREDELVYLVAGERRLRALLDIDALGGQARYLGQLVQPNHAPCVDVGELSPIARMEAELEENIRRVDLNWQERAAATEGLWKLRNMQAEEAGEAPPTIASFTQEVNPRGENPEKVSLGGRYTNDVRQDIILAKYLDDPDVQAAKTPTEALKVLKKKEQRTRNEEHAAAVGATYSVSAHQLFNEDCLLWAVGQESSQFSVIITDPPYGMGADEFGDCGGATEAGHFYDDSEGVLMHIMETFPEQSFRLAAPDAHMYLFCDFDKFHFIKKACERAGWKVFRTPLIWSKVTAFRAPWPSKGPKRTYECILYAIKGNREVNIMGTDVLEFRADENIGHNAQKPVALFEELLARSAHPGDKVIDFFCGSGPIFPAATAKKCYATGVEMDKGAYGIAAKRLEELK